MKKFMFLFAFMAMAMLASAQTLKFTKFVAIQNGQMGETKNVTTTFIFNSGDNGKYIMQYVFGNTTDRTVFLQVAPVENKVANGVPLQFYKTIVSDGGTAGGNGVNVNFLLLNSGELIESIEGSNTGFAFIP